MFFARFLQYLRGYLVISVSGRYPERFFNACASRHILIWNVFPHSQTVVRCCISNRGFRLLPKVAKKTNVRVKIIEKRGLPVRLKQLKKRKIFLFGILFFVLFLIVLNQFIWKIEIVGCQRVSSRTVRETLAECGLRVGVFRPKIDEKKLQNQMLLKMPELAWIWADKSGSRVTVQVKERIPRPKMFDKRDFCNLVAERDGVIDSMIVKGGTPMVQLGDTVQKGDILVSGLILSEKGVAPQKVQADAEIYARVWYEKSKAFSLWQPVICETGRVVRKHTLHLFGLDVNLFLKSESGFASYQEEVQEKKAVVFGRDLQFGITKRFYRETNVTYEKMEPQSLAESGKLELEAELDEMAAPNSKKKEVRMHHTALDEETIEVTVVAEYIENIAKKVDME